LFDNDTRVCRRNNKNVLYLQTTEKNRILVVVKIKHTRKYSFLKCMHNHTQWWWNFTQEPMGSIIALTLTYYITSFEYVTFSYHSKKYFQTSTVLIPSSSITLVLWNPFIENLHICIIFIFSYDQMVRKQLLFVYKYCILPKSFIHHTSRTCLLSILYS